VFRGVATKVGVRKRLGDSKTMNDASPVSDAAQTAQPTRLEAIAALTALGQPYEVEVLEIGGTPQRVFKNGPATLRALFADGAGDAEGEGGPSWATASSAYRSGALKWSMRVSRQSPHRRKRNSPGNL
jgi:hypothetical protein